jgi:hypothetical protein
MVFGGGEMIKALLDGIFYFQARKQKYWLNGLWLVGLFVSGILLWGSFLNWGRGPYNFHDWALVAVPRTAILKDAVTRGLNPLHTIDPAALGGFTDRILSIGDIILSPQILLLKWLEPVTFLVINTLLLYTLGFLGLVLLQRSLKLSLFSTTLFFLLFNFNGHILAHFSVGHTTWSGYFLIPWLILLVWETLEKNVNWTWVAKVSFLLFFIFLQGSYHLFVYCLIFLGFLALAVPKNFWKIIAAGTFSILISMVRISPMILSFRDFKQQYLFIGGYPLTQSIWEMLTTLQIPGESTRFMGLINSLGLWETTFFIGTVGGLFLLGFFIRSILRKPDRSNPAAVLFLPILGMVLLSIDQVYRYTSIILPIPALSGERVPIRFLVLAFAFGLTLAVLECQHWLDTHQPSQTITLGLIGIPVLIFNDLWQNFRLWRVESAASRFPAETLNPAQWKISIYAEPQYTHLLWVGLAVTLLSTTVLVYLTWKERNQTARLKTPDSQPPL